jgi:hypothetical protein
MVIDCLAVNENAVEVNNEENIQVRIEEIVHEDHESGRGVPQSKREYGEFEEPVARS